MWSQPFRERMTVIQVAESGSMGCWFHLCSQYQHPRKQPVKWSYKNIRNGWLLFFIIIGGKNLRVWSKKGKSWRKYKDNWVTESLISYRRRNLKSEKARRKSGDNNSWWTPQSNTLNNLNLIHLFYFICMNVLMYEYQVCDSVKLCFFAFFEQLMVW